jgi:hypothetical protein
MALLKALENRNRCLKQISEFSETFLARVLSGEMNDLDSFETWRNSAMKTLKLFDNHIKFLAKELSQTDRTEKLKTSIKNILEISEKLIYYIINIDSRIIERIELEKTSLLQTLVTAEQNKKTLTKFRSEAVLRSGGQLDGKI